MAKPPKFTERVATLKTQNVSPTCRPHLRKQVGICGLFRSICKYSLNFRLPVAGIKRPIAVYDRAEAFLDSMIGNASTVLEQTAVITASSQIYSQHFALIADQLQ